MSRCIKVEVVDGEFVAGAHAAEVEAEAIVEVVLNAIADHKVEKPSLLSFVEVVLSAEADVVAVVVVVVVLSRDHCQLNMCP
jgi:hypothetical protein